MVGLEPIFFPIVSPLKRYHVLTSPLELQWKPIPHSVLHLFIYSVQRSRKSVFSFLWHVVSNCGLLALPSRKQDPMLAKREPGRCFVRESGISMEPRPLLPMRAPT